MRYSSNEMRVLMFCNIAILREVLEFWELLGQLLLRDGISSSNRLINTLFWRDALSVALRRWHRGISGLFIASTGNEIPGEIG